jgi:hypothetical protein
MNQHSYPPRSCQECKHLDTLNTCKLVDDEAPHAIRTVLFQRSSGFVKDCGPSAVFWEPLDD